EEIGHREELVVVEDDVVHVAEEDEEAGLAAEVTAPELLGPAGEHRHRFFWGHDRHGHIVFWPALAAARAAWRRSHSLLAVTSPLCWRRAFRRLSRSLSPSSVLRFACAMVFLMCSRTPSSALTSPSTERPSSCCWMRMRASAEAILASMLSFSALSF